MSKHFLPLLMKKKTRVIVNSSSICGSISAASSNSIGGENPLGSVLLPYNTSKAALNMREQLQPCNHMWQCTALCLHIFVDSTCQCCLPAQQLCRLSHVMCCHVLSAEACTVLQQPCKMHLADRCIVSVCHSTRHACIGSICLKQRSV